MRIWEIFFIFASNPIGVPVRRLDTKPPDIASSHPTCEPHVVVNSGKRRLFDEVYSGKIQTSYDPPSLQIICKFLFQLALEHLKRVVKRRYEQAQTVAVAVQSLIDLYPQIHEKSGFEFRVYHNADQAQVDLLRTSGFAAMMKKTAGK